LALSVALAGACFVRLFGIAFLGRPRAPVAANALETDKISLSVLLLFAALCLLIGVVPGFVIDALGPVSQSLFHGQMPVQAVQPWLSLVPISAARSSYNGLTLLLMIAAAWDWHLQRSVWRLRGPHGAHPPGIVVSPVLAPLPNTRPEAFLNRSGAFSALCCSAPMKPSKSRRPAIVAQRG
jgi:hypothetical protein